MTNERPLYRGIAAAIRRLIDDGGYPPGSRLPGERELAERFGVSRVTIHEAEIELQAQGCIEIKTGAGAYVKEAAPSGPQLPAASAFELTEARALFESEAAALAARLIGDAQIQYLEDCIRRMVNVPSGHDPAAEEADRDFHMAIAAASGNTVVEHTVAMLWKIRTEQKTVKEVYDSVCSEDAAQRGAEHSQILEALRAHDSAAAREAMRGHFRRLLESMLDAAEQKALAELRRRSDESRRRFLNPASGAEENAA